VVCFKKYNYLRMDVHQEEDVCSVPGHIFGCLRIIGFMVVAECSELSLEMCLVCIYVGILVMEKTIGV
jgi:hypothetical protein